MNYKKLTTVYKFWLAILTLALLFISPYIQADSTSADDIHFPDRTFSIDGDLFNGIFIDYLFAYDDNDENQQFTYSIVSGNIDNAFSLNTTDRIVFGSNQTVAELHVANQGVIDYEINPSFTLIVQAENSEGDTKTATITINVNEVDDYGPNFIINTSNTLTNGNDGVRDSFYTTESNLTFTGRLDQPAELTINDEPVAVASDGTFSYTVILSNPAVSLDFVGTDAAGNTSSRSFNFIKDLTGPDVIISSHGDGSVVEQANITIRGYALDDVSVDSISINGESIPLSFEYIGGEMPGYPFEYAVTLQPGVNTFDLVCADELGNESTRTLTLTLVDDETPPEFYISGNDGLITKEAQYSFTGQLNEPAELNVNDEAISVASDLTFSHTVTLSEGQNTLEFVATDTAGNVSTKSRTIILDSSGPVITITSPQDGSIVEQQNTRIWGRIQDENFGFGSLTINGETINLIFSDAGYYTFDHDITLQSGTNIYNFVATDGLGNESTTSLTLIWGDTTPPVISLDNVHDGLTTKEAQFNFTGQLNEPAELTVNGEAVTVASDLTFSHTLALSEGSNTLAFIATDAAGNSVTESHTITLDLTGPLLTITSHQNGSITEQPNISIAGHFEDHDFDVSSLTMNGESINIYFGEVNVSFEHATTLQLGTNTFNFVSTDYLGNESTTTLTLILDDTTPPVISLNNLDDGLITKEAQFNFTGQLNEPAELTVNGEAVTVASDLTFSHTLTLSEGDNSVTFIATDTANNQLTLARVITLDTVTPNLLISSPANGLITNQLNQSIVGSVSEASTININGVTVPVDDNLSFSYNINLFEGNNEILVEATDFAGNSASQVLNLTLDITPPSLTIASPTNNIVTTQANQTISGSLDQAGTLTINGVEVSLDNELAFSYSLVLSEGLNTITLITSDELGNSQTKSLVLTLDSTKPQISQVNIQDGDVLNQAVHFIEGKLSESGTLTINNQQVVVDNQLSFKHNIDFVEGENTFHFVATDSAGNVTTKDITVTLNDTTAPGLIIDSPSNGLITNQANQTIIGHLDEIANLKINGTDVNVNSDLTFSYGALLASGENTFIIEASDTVSNKTTVVFKMTFDDGLPESPVVTSHPASPAENISAEQSVTITGSREAETSIWINDVKKVDLGSADWSTSLMLPEGVSMLTVVAKDAAENASPATTVQFKVDTNAPVVNEVIPSQISNIAPDFIQVKFSELNTGIDIENTRLTVVRNATIVNGNVAINADNITFTPAASLQEGIYTIRPQLVDLAGNETPINDYTFTLDFTPPSAPVLSGVPSTTTINTVNIEGTKEAGTSIWLLGSQIVAENANTVWSYQASLSMGSNTLTFTSKDSAGNESAGTDAIIEYDDEAPGEVVVSAEPNGNGTEIELDWSGYDEFSNGNDIAEYRVYSALTNFTDPASATLIKNIAAGIKSTSITDLNRDELVYFAVVAVDTQGNTTNTVSAISVKPVDTLAPTSVENLGVNSFDNHLVITWTSLSGTIEDLAGYRLYIDDSSTAIDIDSSATSYDITNLSAATGYKIKLTAIDNDENENTGVSINAATLLTNPVITNAEPYSGLVALNWENSQPQNLVKSYKIYAEPVDYGSSVEGLNAKATVSGNTLASSIAGLTNGTTYWFAVTAVNLSNGETTLVSTATATPTEDTQGPELDNILFDGQAIVNNMDITKSGLLSVNVTDKTTVSRVELLVDNTVVNTKTSGINNLYELPWNILSLDDGNHALTIRAFDTLDNVSTQTFNITIVLSPPSAPTITQPASDITTNQKQVKISGVADLHTEVNIYLNGNIINSPVLVDAQGKYSANLSLMEGDNNIEAKSRFPNRSGESQSSNIRVVTVDLSIPDAPTGLIGKSSSLGEIRLSWNSVVDSLVTGYNIYRSETPFDTINESGVEKINTALITNTAVIDLPTNNGSYFYKVTSVNNLGSESSPSLLAEAVSDSLGPRATQISYIPDGNVDSNSGRVGPGLVDVEVTFDEALRNEPYFAMVPDGGVPIVIELTKDRNNDKLYTGHFVIENNTPSGNAFAVLTAHDQYNNRGTEIEAGESLLIDTSGPDLISLSVAPSSPIQVDPQGNDSARTIQVIFQLNDKLSSNTLPRFIPKLDSIPLVGYSNGISLSREESSSLEMPVWTGSFILPTTAGQDEQGNDGVQILSFDYSAFDDLDNESSKISANNQFQVYQGALPPTDIPFNLTAKAIAGGSILLNWEAVEQASGYRLYRQSVNDTEMTLIADLSGVETISYSDNGLADGLYQYAIASVRKINAQESESALSDPVTVTADATQPEAPRNLELELNGAGIVLRWLAPNNEMDPSELTYNLYRLPIDQSDAVDLEDVSPIQADIPNLTDPIALDSEPDRNARTYVVTAVDQAGNESEASNAVTQQIELLPVSNLAITLDEQSFPNLTWSHNDDNVIGYDIYIDSITEENKLNILGVVSDTSFTDTSYNNGVPSNGADTARKYIVVAIDDLGNRSIGHTLILPALSVALSSSTTQELQRGIMNKLLFRVENRGNQDTTNQRLFVSINDNGTIKEHQSESFDVDAGSFSIIPVVVGGYVNLDNLGELQLRLSQSPQAGEQVTIKQSDAINITDSALSISLTTESFVRGATGKVKFTVENISDVETELLLAQANGKTASNELRLVLEDSEGNTLSTQAIKQFDGGAITTTSGNSVARIAPASSFTSGLTEIAIPSAAPDEVQLRLEIDSYHYHLDRPDHVKVKGGTALADVKLVDTSYYAEVTSISESVTYGNKPIVIKGRSLDRSTVSPLANVPVKLIFRVSGFERSGTVYTDSLGDFEYTYAPSNQESGLYQVSAIHPDMVERPNHGQFTIQNSSVVPEQYNLTIPKNFDKPLSIKISTGKATPLHNLRVEYLAEDQINSTFPAGVTIQPGPNLNVDAGKTVYLKPVFRADQTSSDSGQIRLRVVSDDNLANSLGFVTVKYTLSAAVPSLSVSSPGYIETGVGLDKSTTEKMTISNKGLAPLTDIRLSLTQIDGVTPAPSWLYISSGNQLDDMNVGAAHTINVTVNPSNLVTEDDYEFRLKVSSAELGDTLIPVYVAVTQSGIGSVFFHASDIYTATLDEYGQAIPGLNGARIKLQNELVLTQEFNVTADANGEALFADIPAGRYIFRASAPNHQDVTGRIIVKPGITVAEEVFLMNEIVTVEFSVNEITIQDRYEIILEATYETSVPVAVVIADPVGINLPAMKKGQTLLGEVSLTNHGLIRADNLSSELPASTDLVKFELLTQVPDILEAGEAIVLPYRITALNDFNPGTGGCGQLAFPVCHNYDSMCANGAVVPGNACTTYYSSWGVCESSPTADTVWSSGGYGGGGTGISTQNAPQSITQVRPQCLGAGGKDCAGVNGSGE